MCRIYMYKLTTDNGGAPCVDNNLLSLAICKPIIRRTAQRGDVIFGFAANKLNKENPLIYVAVITDKKENGDYYRDPKYRTRCDCIYKWSQYQFSLKRSAKYHSTEDPLKRKEHFVKDIIKSNDVLLSRDFRYFGGEGTAGYKKKYRHIREAIDKMSRNFQVNHSDDLQRELESLKNEIWSRYSVKKIGMPHQIPASCTEC